MCIRDRCDGVNFVLVPALFAICVAGLHPMVIALSLIHI